MADRTIVLSQNGRHAVRGLSVNNPSEFSAYQDDDDDLTYIVDLSAYLDGATITVVTRVPQGVFISNSSNTTTRLTQRLRGFGYVDFKVQTSAGDVEEFRINILRRVGSKVVLGASGGGGTGVTPGDYGDISISAGNVWTIDNGAVTNAKMADMASNTIKGVTTTGAPTDLSANSAITVLNTATNALDFARLSGVAASSHTHGNISNAGAIGSTANLPVITTTSGVLTTGSFGTTANTFAQGNDSRLSDTRTPTDGSVTNAKVTSTFADGIESSKLRFTQAGTGADVRSVESKLREAVSITDFGASTSNNGATNKTAIDEAVAAVSAAGGGTVLVPAGTFDITTLANIPPNVTIRGVSRSKSVLRTTSATGDVIKLDGSRAGVANLTISSSVTRTANAYIGHTANASQIFVDSVDLLAPFIGIEISSDIAVFIITDVAIRDTVTTTGNSIVVRGGYVVHLDRVMCSQSSGAIRPANHLLIESVHDIQVVNTQFIGAANDVNIAPGNGQTVFSVQMCETLFDDAQGPAIRVAPTGTGIVREVFVESPWIFGTAQDVLVTNAGGGTVQLFNIANSLFVGTGAGVDITGANQAIVQNCRIGGHTTAVSYNNVGRGLITGNLLGPNGPYGNNTTAISLVGTTANVIVQGNETSGNTTALSNSATGVNYIEMGYGKAPVTVTGTTYTIGADNEYIFNVSSTCTVTLPTASANTGRKIKLRSIWSAVVSNASNVVPVQGGSAGTAIIYGGGGWAELVSNGTSWLVQESNRYAAIDGGTIANLSDLSVSKTTGNSATVRANSGSAYGDMTFNDAAGMYLSNSSSVPFYFYVAGSEKLRIQADGNVLVTSTGGLGYGTGSGGAVTQATSRTTGVTLNNTNGAITLVSAAGSTTEATFTVTNSKVAATDTVIVSQKSGTDKYIVNVSAVAAGSFNITFRTFSGTTTEQPVFNFAVIKAVAA